MMTAKNTPAIALALLLSVGLAACGNTKKIGSTNQSSAAVASAPPAVLAPPSTPSVVAPPSATGLPLLRYNISQTGASPSFSTGSITTDNVLKVKFQVGTTQGNSMWQASELKVTISANGHIVNPTYTASNYGYGLSTNGGEISQELDLSSSLSPGVPVVITVNSPMNNYYCTYWPNDGYWGMWNGQIYGTGFNADHTTLINPLFDAPGCRKAVASMHTWSGTLIVQTNSTVAISTITSTP